MPSRWSDYWQLCKPRVVALLSFTALIGMLLAAPVLPPLVPVVAGLVGITLMAASAAALNQVFDRRIDAIMARTRRRPLPDGRIGTVEGLAFAAAIGTVGLVLLWFAVNPLTAILTLATLVGYSLIYTCYLKWKTPQNIVIGGASGAFPPVLGWAAVTGEVSAEAMLLFLIVFLWTPPHFWALAIYRLEDYRSASVPVLPVTHGHELTRLHILLYTILLVVISLFPYLIGMSGLLYLGGALVFGALYLAHAWRLLRGRRSEQPMRAFRFSINYLLGLFSVMLIDHYLQLFL